MRRRLDGAAAGHGRAVCVQSAIQTDARQPRAHAGMLLGIIQRRLVPLKPAAVPFEASSGASQCTWPTSAQHRARPSGPPCGAKSLGCSCKPLNRFGVAWMQVRCLNKSVHDAKAGSRQRHIECSSRQ